jgi:hypothetical protein
VIATDALTIYESGSQYQITIDEVLNNPVALKMLFNELNQVKKELAAAKQGSVPPTITGVLAIANALGVVLVAFGTVYLSMNPSPMGAGWLVAIGGTLTLLTSLTPAVMAFSRSKKQKQAAERSEGDTSARLGMDRPTFEQRLQELVNARRRVRAAEEAGPKGSGPIVE